MAWVTSDKWGDRCENDVFGHVTSPVERMKMSIRPAIEWGDLEIGESYDVYHDSGRRLFASGKLVELNERRAIIDDRFGGMHVSKSIMPRFYVSWSSIVRKWARRGG